MVRLKKDVEENQAVAVTEEVKTTVAEEIKKEPKVASQSLRQSTKEKLAKLISEETKIVKGRFRNYEAPGGSLRVQIRKYPGIPAFDKVMIDNEMYEVPLYVARHLNGIDVSAGGCGQKINTCSWPTHGFKAESDGSLPGSRLDDMGIAVPIIGVSKWNKRFGFESLEFDAAM